MRGHHRGAGLEEPRGTERLVTTIKLKRNILCRSALFDSRHKVPQYGSFVRQCLGVGLANAFYTSARQ